MCRAKTRFLSTSPARGTTRAYGPAKHVFSISIHVPREGDDVQRVPHLSWEKNFYPRPPRGGRLLALQCGFLYGDFYPRPPRGGRQAGVHHQRRTQAISIHVPREGDDALGLRGVLPVSLFLSTSPARGTTGTRRADQVGQSVFLSTSPARGTTTGLAWGTANLRYFYPRPPRGGRPTGLPVTYREWPISIHVPREGDDWRKNTLPLPI